MGFPLFVTAWSDAVPEDVASMSEGGEDDRDGIGSPRMMWRE